jgi:FG-GAP-like repeat
MKKQRWMSGVSALAASVAAVAACGGGGPETPPAGAASAAAGAEDGGGAGFTSGSWASGAAQGGSSNGDDCAAGETLCDGACVELRSDGENCGECGASCSAKRADASCADGACVIEQCEDGFVDCNGAPADGCEAPDEGLPTPPRALSPAIGQNTGSALSAAARRPQFRWTPGSSAGSCGAVTYQLQVDDSCTVGEPCGFESPEVDESGIDGLGYRADQPLEVARSVPVGTRYFWRVRACEAGARCSGWSDARYLNVGRLSDDLNGDGYSDFFATSYDGESPNHLHLRPGPLPEVGASSEAVRPTLNLAGGVDVYGAARFLGDVNGDGFADAIRGNTSGAELVLGHADFQKIASVQLTGDFAGQHGVAGLGDWNGDGFADFAFSDSHASKETPPSVVHVYSGSAEAQWKVANIAAPAGTTAASFGVLLEGGVDFDGDGYTDLFVLDGNDGRVHFAAGGAASAGKFKAALTTGTTCDYYLRPTLARAGDMNGDGFGEVAVRCGSRLMVFAGGRTPSLTPLWSHSFSADAASLGHGIAGGADLGSDGLSDLLVHGEDKSGMNLYHLAGSATLSQADQLVPFRGALSKDGTARAGDGLSLGDFDGDGRADLLVQVKDLGEVRLFSGGKSASGSCPAASDAESLGDWCRSATMTIEGKYETRATPSYPIGSSFGAGLAQ